MHQKLLTLLFLSEPFLVPSLFRPGSCDRPFKACLCLQIVASCVAWSMRLAFFSSAILRLHVCYYTMQKRTFWKRMFLVIYWTAYVSLVVGTIPVALLSQHAVQLLQWTILGGDSGIMLLSLFYIFLLLKNTSSFHGCH